MKQSSRRAGVFRIQPAGYSAFIPNSLVPIPSLNWDDELATLLTEAGLGIGRLDGLTRGLINPNLFVSIFVRQEAVLSSQIEGTQCTLEDVLNFPLEHEKDKDVQTVIRYIDAMNYGLAKLNDRAGLPLCVRLLREIHSVLLAGSRGEHLEPGEVRRSQNWIGPQGSTIMTATYVPPPLSEMHESLSDLEKFLQLRAGVSPLVQVALAHAQFETIHPFLDGNGRLGRLLIALFLCERKILNRPVLYLSHYLKSNQYEYYNRLTAIREDGDWEGWLKFFLRGVRVVSDQAVRNAELLIELRAAHQEIVNKEIGTVPALNLLDYLWEQPIVTVQMVSQHLGCAFVTAQRIVEDFEKAKLVRETTGQRRNRRFEYEPYLQFWKAAQVDYGQIHLAEPKSLNSASLQERFGELTVAWITNGKKLVFLHDDSNTFIGMRVMFNEEVRSLLREFNLQRSFNFDSLDLQPIRVLLSGPLLREFENQTVSDRDLELVGKEAIVEAFYSLREVLGKRTDGAAGWNDSSNGSFLSFSSSGVGLLISLGLEEIKNYVVNPSVRTTVQQKIASQLDSLPDRPVKSDRSES